VRYAGLWRAAAGAAVVSAASAVLWAPPASGDTVISPQTATISIEQPYAPPGGRITVDGAGFGHHETVTVEFDGAPVGFERTDGRGAFSGVVDVPASATPGDHAVQATGRRTDRSASATLLVRTDWPQPRFDEQSSGFNPYENVLGPVQVPDLQLVWKYHPHGIEYTPSIVGGVAYVSVEDFGVVALDLATRRTLWTTPGGGNGTTVADGVVYDVDVESNLRAIDAASGSVLWTYTVDRLRGSGPVAGDGAIFFGTGYDNTIEAIDASTGKERWNVPLGGQADHPPAVDGGVVYASASSGPLFAIDAATGATDWTYSCGASCSQPAVAGGVVFVGNEAGDLSALDGATGSLRWKVHLVNHGAIAGAAVADGAVYVGIDIAGKTDHVIAVDTVSGGVVWDSLAFYHYPSAPVVADGVVYDWSRSRNDVDAYRASDGQLLWSVHMHNSGGVNGVAISDGMMYASSSSGLHVFAAP
jgi:outer membrane protein assembly factor BamB